MKKYFIEAGGFYKHTVIGPETALNYWNNHSNNIKIYLILHNEFHAKDWRYVM